jgi:hypothetical protein
MQLDKITGAKLIVDGGYWLCLRSDHANRIRTIVDEVNGRPDKLHDAEIRIHREKRSLNANAYAWVLMEQIAQKIGSSKEEVYLDMLRDYGVFTHLIVKPAAVGRVMQEWRTARNLGEVTVNGQTGIQLQCYYGSHGYDTGEMSRLIDGIVSECRDLGIETATPEELARMKEEWGR